MKKRITRPKNTFSRVLKAFSTLIAVMVLLMFSVLILVSMSTGLISRFQSSLSFSQSYQLEITAESCREEVFGRLKNSLSYTGGTIVFPGGTCMATVQGTDTAKTVLITVQNGAARKNLQAELAISVSGEAINLSLLKLQTL